MALVILCMLMATGLILARVDILNKTNPIKIGEIMLDNYVNSLFVSGSYVYVANAISGLRIINVSNINNIQEVGYYETPESALGIFVSGSYAYVTAWARIYRVLQTFVYKEREKW